MTNALKPFKMTEPLLKLVLGTADVFLTWQQKLLALQHEVKANAIFQRSSFSIKRRLLNRALPAGGLES